MSESCFPNQPGKGYDFGSSRILDTQHVSAKCLPTHSQENLENPASINTLREIPSCFPKHHVNSCVLVHNIPQNQENLLGDDFRRTVSSRFCFWATSFCGFSCRFFQGKMPRKNPPRKSSDKILLNFHNRNPWHITCRIAEANLGIFPPKSSGDSSIWAQHPSQIGVLENQACWSLLHRWECGFVIG